MSSIRVDDLVEVHPGESITIDGVIERGQAFVCETPLTGEPFAQVRRVGDQVAAGSVVEDATLWLRATVAGDAREIDGVLAAVEQARRTRISLQRQIDRWAQVFLPVVVLVAVGTYAFWWQISGWEQALFHAMSVLLVACPCALGLAAPLAIWATMSHLANRGLVAHHADFVEQLAKTNHAVFDKTGTLTEDAAAVADIAVAPHISRNKLLSWLSSAERHSRHPVARALAACVDEDIELAADQPDARANASWMWTRSELRRLLRSIASATRRHTAMDRPDSSGLSAAAREACERNTVIRSLSRWTEAWRPCVWYANACGRPPQRPGAVVDSWA